MTTRLGLLALPEAKSDKGSELGAFLENGRAIAAAEQGTVTWYAFKISDTSYAIFDTFETDDARQAHLGGEIPQTLAEAGGGLNFAASLRLIAHSARRGLTTMLVSPASCARSHQFRESGEPPTG